MKTIKIFAALSIFVMSFSNAQMDDKFYQPKKEMKTMEFKSMEPISIPVTDDTITAVMAKPEKKATKTILFFHGSGGNISTYQYIIKPLVDTGYQVVMVDFRGYGNSTGKPTHLNIAEDGQKFFDEMLKREDVKNTKVYLYGASLGTQVAAHLAKENAGKISGVILDCPMESFTEVAAHYAPQYADMIRSGYISPYSPIEDLKDLSTPKLIILSQKDSTIPYAQQKKVFETASEPKQSFESTGEHIQGMVENKAEILKMINNL